MAQILRLPSCEGRGEYDRFVRAPKGMSEAEAIELVNAEITRANAEDARNCEMVGGGCDDGLCVEESLLVALSKVGFVFFKPSLTLCWDAVAS